MRFILWDREYSLVGDSFLKVNGVLFVYGILLMWTNLDFFCFIGVILVDFIFILYLMIE